MDHIASEIATWARLHKKPVQSYADDLSMILDELIKSGYTVREALSSGLRERLRRHRWDLNIGIFYPDDKLITSEITQGFRRAYRHGFNDGKATQSAVPVETVSREELSIFVRMEALQHHANELFAENQKLKTRVAELESAPNQQSANQSTNETTP